MCPAAECDFVYWDNPVPVVAIIAELGDLIILAHNRSWPKGIFSVISGYVESKESPEAACVRELKEELGLDADEIHFVGNFIFRKLNQLMIAYHVKVSGEIKMNDELDEIKLVRKEQLIGWKREGRFEVGEWLNNFKIIEE
jgi:NADH pyrophosphatase NudC (nudix superfamily)